MSWVKKPGGPPPEQPAFAPQQYNNQPQQSMYPNYAGAQPVWPQQPQQQQFKPNYPPYQQEYAPNANQLYQQQYNQSYQYTQPGYQQYYNQPQPNPGQNPDNWDNWDWGWEESAKQAQLAAQNAAPQQFNNANVIEESFASTDTWNWSMEDKKEAEKSAVTESKPEPARPPQVEEVKLSDKDTVKERAPNLALGKRFHTDNLTPQWSIESQMSQESSEGIHTHSESTFRSETQSRNSTKSSPGITTDATSFNFPHDEALPPIDWPTPTADEAQQMEQRKSHDDLTSSLQELSIANEEPASQDRDTNAHDEPSPSQSPSQPAMPPAPPVTAATLPPPTAPPPTAVLPPPTNFPPSNQNPFKNTGSFSHKATSNQPFSGMSGLTSPAAVNKVQHRPPVGFGANLETTPDNSERPDQPQVAFRPIQVTQQVPDNLEVAPQNDRNEYLQTAHLSTGDYGENTDFSRTMPPPPGLRRMVVGQQETEYGQASADEPPPGLARMVPGQPTEADNTYNQPSDNYMDRLIDGQPTEDNSRPYRQADGQQTPEHYTQPAQNRTERRPVGLDRMVPGEPSNDEYPQYQPGYSNEQRVVTGVDHDYPNAGPTDIREQNVDGSDYTETTPRNPFGNVRGSTNDVSSEYNGPPEEQQREVMMEGENLQDLSAIAPVDMTFTREQALDGADMNVSDIANDRKTDLSENDHPVTSSRRQSINRGTSGEESERDRYKSSPRRDRDKHKSSRDKDRDRDRDGRYSRDSRGKYDSERRVRREDKERRRERGDSPEGRKPRRGTRSHRYETEDTDYYSDRERERRRYREGSYGKPPRPDDYRRHDDRRRHNTSERERRYEEDERRRYGRYRDIDPNRKYGNLRREDERDRRGDPYASPSRTESRDDRGPTDDELNDTHASSDPRRRDRDRRRRLRVDPYYDGYASVYADPYALQRQQYQYYEHLRQTDPQRYKEVYKQIMAGHHLPPPPEYLAATKMSALEGYSSLGYDGRMEDRGSVHSGRSSANGLKGTDTYYGYRHDASLRDATSLRTDLSDRELNTDASLNLHLEESTVRSERMTPFKFSTAHIKGSISSRHVVVVRPSYPVDGLPATVQILSLAAAVSGQPGVHELASYPGPLVKGVTHKKTVIEYCAARARAGSSRGDSVGYALVWDLLSLLLRQNGVVVGTDIAELLMKNKRDFELSTSTKSTPNADGRGSSVSEEEAGVSHASDLTPPEERSCIDEKTAVDQLREYLTYGNRQEAIEWAMSHKLWGHAFQLAAHGDRRARAAVAARFLAGVPRADPLHSLYHSLAGRQPPVATCAADERWGDWRAHAAIILSNASSKPDNETRTLTQLGDTLLSRGQLYSAQFCYLAARVPFSRHPLAPLAPPPAAQTAPPRLALLLADSRADSLRELATNEAIFATEIYEYALSLSQDYCINELQVYKFALACRLVDAGEYERALAYAEAVARAVTRAPRDYPPRLVAQVAILADRLKYHDPALNEDPPLVEEGGDSGEPSPRHHQQWLGEVASVAQTLAAEAEASRQAAPAHAQAPPAPAPDYYPPQYGWGEPPAQHDYNTLQQQQPLQSAYPEPYQPEEPYYPQPEEPQEPEWRKDDYAEPYWPQEQYQYEEDKPAQPVSTRRAPTARVPPRTLARPLPALDETLETNEYHRSPGLRKRIHPKNKTVNVGFTDPRVTPSPGRMRTISRGSSGSAESDKAKSPKKPLSDLDIQIAHSPQFGAPALEPTKSQMFEATRRGRYGKVIGNTVDSWARQTVHVRDGTYKPLIFGGTYPIEVPASPPEEKTALEKVTEKVIPVAEVKATIDQAAHRRELKKTIERSLDRFEAILAKRDTAGKRQAFSKRVVNTFDIDEPVNLSETKDLPRDKDARYYVSGPKTFNIDEPVTFI